MTLSEQIHAYFTAWNSHDATQLAGLFAAGGTYEDPVTRIAVGPFDVPTVLESLQTVFPDFRFEVVSQTLSGERAMVEWVLFGTNQGPLKVGIEPTGRTLRLRGVEVLEASAGGLTRVTRYFDQKAMVEQIGLQVLFEPIQQGKAVYGYSQRASSGSTKVPGIIALTWIKGRDDSERDRIRAHAGKIVHDFLQEPGFISIVTGFAGDRGFTVTAWEDEESLRRALGKQHARAKHDFRTSGLSPGVWTSVWRPHHINRIWTRCLACQQPNDVTDDHRGCTHCGASLPERPTFW